jgi:hypothetical protein
VQEANQALKLAVLAADLETGKDFIDSENHAYHM